jgi:hypothetical protein
VFLVEHVSMFVTGAASISRPVYLEDRYNWSNMLAFAAAMAFMFVR